MKKITLLIIAISFLFFSCSTQKNEKQDLAQYVNPFVGTGGHGHTYPGAIAPFGMIQNSPDTRMILGMVVPDITFPTAQFLVSVSLTSQAQAATTMVTSASLLSQEKHLSTLKNTVLLSNMKTKRQKPVIIQSSSTTIVSRWNSQPENA